MQLKNMAYSVNLLNDWKTLLTTSVSWHTLNQINYEYNRKPSASTYLWISAWKTYLISLLATFCQEWRIMEYNNIWKGWHDDQTMKMELINDIANKSFFRNPQGSHGLPGNESTVHKEWWENQNQTQNQVRWTLFMDALCSPMK